MTLTRNHGWARQATVPIEWRMAGGIRGKSLADGLVRSHRIPAGVAQVRHLRDAVLARLEAVLFASQEPLTPRRLMKLTGLADTGEVRRQVHRLDGLLQAERSAFFVDEIAGGYQLLTRPEPRVPLERICQIQSDTPLSGPMLETLAIVAYRQPICRADVEAIRGVELAEILRHLLDRGLLRIAGKEETLGRPYLYATTRKFLQVFGLRSLHELPMVEALRVEPASTTAAETENDAEGRDEDAGVLGGEGAGEKNEVEA